MGLGEYICCAHALRNASNASLASVYAAIPITRSTVRLYRVHTTGLSHTNDATCVVYMVWYLANIFYPSVPSCEFICDGRLASQCHLLAKSNSILSRIAILVKYGSWFYFNQSKDVGNSCENRTIHILKRISKLLRVLYVCLLEQVEFANIKSFATTTDFVNIFIQTETSESNRNSTPCVWSQSDSA